MSRHTLTDVTLDPWSTSAIATRAKRMRGFPRVGDGVHQQINLLESYVQLAAVAMARAEFYGELLAAQLDKAASEATDGNSTSGLIAETITVSVVGNGPSAELQETPTGEEIRALVELEAKERDRAAKLIKDAVSMGAQIQQTEALRTYGNTIAAALQTFTVEVGLSLNDEPVLRAAQRAGLTARRQLGQEDGDPDRLVGPRMAPGERVSALREALRVAEADAARTREVTA